MKNLKWRLEIQWHESPANPLLYIAKLKDYVGSRASSIDRGGYGIPYVLNSDFNL